LFAGLSARAPGMVRPNRLFTRPSESVTHWEFAGDPARGFSKAIVAGHTLLLLHEMETYQVYRNSGRIATPEKPVF